MTSHFNVTGRKGAAVERHKVPSGEQEEEEGGPVLIPAPAVLKRHGISAMTLWRWLHDADLGFPRPIDIRRRRFFRLAELEAWEAGLNKRGAA
jgi:predicted DNA-binding transcriptional regulator AlpA